MEHCEKERRAVARYRVLLCVWSSACVRGCGCGCHRLSAARLAWRAIAHFSVNARFTHTRQRASERASKRARVFASFSTGSSPWLVSPRDVIALSSLPGGFLLLSFLLCLFFTFRYRRQDVRGLLGRNSWNFEVERSRWNESYNSTTCSSARRNISSWIYLINFQRLKLLYYTHCGEHTHGVRIYWGNRRCTFSGKLLYDFDTSIKTRFMVFSFICSCVSCNLPGDNWCLRNAGWFTNRFFATRKRKRKSR